jgi:hypothetical protein
MRVTHGRSFAQCGHDKCDRCDYQRNNEKELSMQIRPALAALCAVATLAAFATPAAHAANSQQEKMKACNAQAGDKKGDERKAFMKQCLSAAAPAAASAPMTQQEKMKACNAQATGKKGDERKAFMKDCLSAKAAG